MRLCFSLDPNLTEKCDEVSEVFSVYMPGVLECLTAHVPLQYYIVRVRDQDLKHRLLFSIFIRKSLNFNRKPHYDSKHKSGKNAKNKKNVETSLPETSYINCMTGGT